MKYKDIIEIAYKKTRNKEDLGELAKYIPELSLIDPTKFGVHLSGINNCEYGIGDYQEKFSIQSISKVFALSLAYRILGKNIWQRVGIEPSGTAFNSLVQLEYEKGIPRNPFINAGALVICDILISLFEDPLEETLKFIRMLANNNEITYSHKTYESEKSTGYRNVALCNLIKAFGNINNEPEEVLDFYFKLCSLEMTCKQLSESCIFLANQGKTLHNKEEILNKTQTKRVNAIMQSCGLYDESGEFAFRVGLAGKSGVGGGIIAILPNHYSIAVWSPKLNPKGNSYKGLQFLIDFSTISEESIF